MEVTKHCGAAVLVVPRAVIEPVWRIDLSTVRLPLTQGNFALISDSDLELVSAYRWRAVTPTERPYTQYVISTNRPPNRLWLHRLIMNPPDDMDVDHKDGNGLNNTRENLRIVTTWQNNANARGWRNATSAFKGVALDKHTGRWRVQVTHRGRKTHVGRFDTEIEAARAYDAFVFELRGEFAFLNFPEEIDRG